MTLKRWGGHRHDCLCQIEGEEVEKHFEWLETEKFLKGE